jgi:hypothetical protein
MNGGIRRPKACPATVNVTMPIAMPVEEASTASLAVVGGHHGNIVTDTDQSAYVPVTFTLPSV